MYNLFYIRIHHSFIEIYQDHSFTVHSVFFPLHTLHEMFISSYQKRRTLTETCIYSQRRFLIFFFHKKEDQLFSILQ
ncbi:hypothetical protein I7I50_07047 [Histoplasma capsulatum G186AR]|uniref:Uncharacterized protein n=1 Tax=Ajellomyces capsulatus TaxID=5037 RepID=A0A8H7YYH0_AJECA|nr:hypothetical protein I7I52_09879 [Histoplasma capsulatum]QSS67849.1 hypothetical protein I7I50_07047 [Histoplasma capsulatum G186AR]